MPPDEVTEFLVGGIHELDGGEAALVAEAWVGAGLEHHLDEGPAKGPLGGRFGVEPADGGVQRGVAVEAVERVALEVGLVEENVDDFVCEGGGGSMSAARCGPFLLCWMLDKGKRD